MYITSKDLAQLKRIAQDASFKNAQFGMNEARSEEIKKETETYRNTWVIDPLLAIIEHIENKGK